MRWLSASREKTVPCAMPCGASALEVLRHIPTSPAVSPTTIAAHDTPLFECVASRERATFYTVYTPAGSLVPAAGFHRRGKRESNLSHSNSTSIITSKKDRPRICPEQMAGRPVERKRA